MEKNHKSISNHSG